MEAAQQFEVEIRALAEKGQSQQDSYRQRVADTLEQLKGWVSRFDDLNADEIIPIREALFQGGLLSKETLKQLNSILADLSEQTDQNRLRQQQRELQGQLQKGYAQKAELAGIDSQQAKKQQLLQQQQTIQIRLHDLNQQLSAENETIQALNDLNTQIQKLDKSEGQATAVAKKIFKSGRPYRSSTKR